MESLLKVSHDENHWTNFGPVSHLLENEIHKILKLNDTLAVVACSNGTTALHSLVEMYNTIHQRDLKWVVSSYGFYCSHQGPLKDALVVDCNREGMLDLSLIPDMSFDGMVVTNIFGTRQNLSLYQEFCSQHGKILLGDSATALKAIEHGANEIISFHHTKPWGFGEGGCAIVKKEDEKLFRSLINFGDENGVIGRRSTNAKMSDIAAADILQWLHFLPEIEKECRAQYKRIASLALECGFEILGPAEHPGIPPNVPLLAPCPIAHLDNPFVVLRKYYQPLDNSPVAHDLYSRIINIPCHKEMAELSDDTLITLFQDLLNNSRIRSAR